MGELYEIIKRHGGKCSLKDVEKENPGLALELKKTASKAWKK